MFLKRLLSGIVLVVLALVFLISGGALLAGLLLAISLIGMNELYRAVKVEEKKLSLLALVGYLGCAGYYILVFLNQNIFAMEGLMLALILMMAVYVFAYPAYRFEQVSAAFFGFLYVGVMLSCIYQIRTLEHGVYLVWLIFIASWGSDTCAYCIGMLFGKHKMSPKLSPKKSIEGAIGGVAGAGLLGALYAAALCIWLHVEVNYALLFVVVCVAGALISMVGDLAASAIKRNFDIKDYGTLIPGHGGILDRFDSVIFVAPIVYYLTAALMGKFFT